MRYTLCLKEKRCLLLLSGRNVPERGTSVRLLSTGQRMKWIERDGKVAVTLPAKLAGSTEPIALQFDTPLPKQNKK